MTTSPTTSPTPPDEHAHEGHPQRWTILAILVLSLVVVVAGNTSLNVAIPTLVRELGATNTQLQWMVDSYALVFAGFLLPAGALGDRFGRKGALQFGLGVFALAAILSTMADSPSQLIATRALGGFGAAFIMPATLSILAASFPPHERGRAIAVWAGFAGAGGAIGNIVSGYLLEHFWWGSVFFVNVPIVLLAIVLGMAIVPTSKDATETPLDPWGSLLSTAGLAALLFGIIEGPERGWTDPITLAAFAVGVVALASFITWERRTDHPMLPIRFFADRRFSVGAGVILLVFMAMFGLFFISTQYLQFVKQYSPFEAGLAILPSALTMVTVAPRSDGLVQRYGIRTTIASGLTLVAIGLGSIALLDATSPYAQYAVSLVIMSAGMATTMAPATAAIMSSLPLDKAGVGSAVNDTTREVGGALGIAVIGSILNVVYRARVTDSIEAVDALPAGLAEGARESVGAALAVARDLPGAAGDALRQAAETAFTDAMGLAALTGAGIVVGAVVLVLRALPRSGAYEPDPRDPVEATVDGMPVDAGAGEDVP
ncbi:DHA2 family efflux MFS transporter permease subunit [Actinomarinicola tropica]|uniref:DHA2 family efflux MFS transporter permease subunit n=1 Tax=Actinomarinicola tropica TaxID=2789776 RepID=A0A5Q2RAP6_9ACTN|nr:DHA2 family efflux MFS transporter permease subunit [Actinomarinicola tropica]QGG93939.1 DHA2 family efflux MFS transporter permease subunit [Actinomarinicola tropica]